jgi:hypothetical protein
MLLLYLSGDRTAALRQFRRCAAALHDELGVSVSRATLDLLQLIETENVLLRSGQAPIPMY